jgi:hypothetical protein
MELSKNPLFPILLDDYPKLFDYVLSAQGLIYFHQLKRDFVLGRKLNVDEYNKIRLLHVYYATANRNSKEVFAWQNMCKTLDDQGMFEKNMYQSKEDLKNKSLIVINPMYQSGLYRKHIEFVKKNMNSK